MDKEALDRRADELSHDWGMGRIRPGSDGYQIATRAALEVDLESLRLLETALRVSRMVSKGLSVDVKPIHEQETEAHIAVLRKRLGLDQGT